MKISRNVIFVEEKDGNYIAANTLTRSIIRLSLVAKEDLIRGNVKTLNELSKKEFEQCIEMGFLVDDDLNESNWLSYIIHKDRLNPQNLSTYITFSTVCNFACVYCLEAGQVKTRTMDREMVDKVIKWHETKLKNSNYKTCYVHLYGGEPLIMKELIVYFLKKIKNLTKKFNVDLQARLITNGYLLTGGVVKEFIKYGLTGVHVTLDGDEKKHNIRRPLKNGGETFRVVFNNLLNISKLNLGIDIECRISVDFSNFKDIPVLLDKIKQKDIWGNIQPYFGFIEQTTDQKNDPNSFCSKFVLKDPKKVEIILYLFEEAKKRNFSIPDFFTLGPCMAVSDNAGVISPDGKIYKCLNMMDSEGLDVGHVSTNIPKPLYYDFMSNERFDACISTDCPFVPICGTGCVMESYLKSGDISKIVCHREMLTKIHQGLLPLQFS